MNLGERIRELRKQAKLSQSDFEKITGVKREYLSKYENNELLNPTFKTLSKIAKGLNINVITLLGGINSTKEVQELQTLLLAKQREIDNLEDIVSWINKSLETIKTTLANLKCGGSPC